MVHARILVELANHALADLNVDLPYSGRRHTPRLTYTVDEGEWLVTCRRHTLSNAHHLPWSRAALRMP